MFIIGGRVIGIVQYFIGLVFRVQQIVDGQVKYQGIPFKTHILLMDKSKRL